jgi:hypothetical protein
VFFVKDEQDRAIKGRSREQQSVTLLIDQRIGERPAQPGSLAQVK